MENIVEALLFASGEPVKIMDIANVLNVDCRKAIEIVENYAKSLEENKRPLMIRKLDDSYQLCTEPKYYEYISKLYEPKQKQGLSNAAMETLSIIAYKQPITRSEIEKIRGVNSDRSVSSLMEFGLVSELGKLDAPGKPRLYGTTDDFLRVFGYSSLSELPEIVLEENLDEENTENK